jgi:hypothetical protein
MLRITVYNRPDALTFQLEGMLAGPWVRELEKCYRSTLTSRPERTVRVDLTAVTFIDAAGRACLTALHHSGAEFLAADCATKPSLTKSPNQRSKSRTSQKDNVKMNATTQWKDSRNTMPRAIVS